MDKSRNLKYYDELDDQGQFEEFNCPRQAPRPAKPRHESLVVAKFNDQFVNQQDDSHNAVKFSYQAARFEAGWLMDMLAAFFEHKWIADVLCKVKVGKEANVYLCLPGEALSGVPLVAAKLYRPRMFRNLKNDNLYRDGRMTLNEDGKITRDLGMLKAQHKRSMYGEEVRLQSWIAYEFLTLQKLRLAGADVPEPYEMGASAILMEYIGDAATAAPTLNTIPLERLEAEVLFERTLENIRIMLANGIVHADLSAYNLLYWQGSITLIDFPQVISPEGNRNAWQIFSRDVRRVCEYFIRQGVRCEPGKLAADLWKAAGYHIRPEVNPLLLDANDPADLQYFQKNREAE